MYKYFSDIDFDNCVPRCSIKDMDPLFLKLLDEARDEARVPFILNSAFRSHAWEIDKGRDGTSSHCKGLAVDIRCTTSNSRLNIIKALLKVGFNRIGIHRGFIHVDFDKNKPSCIWLYN